jgi:ankyrin repeat protein
VDAAPANGETVLFRAAKNNQTKVVKRLLDAGASVNGRATTDSGVTPLFISSLNGHVEVVKWLLAAKAAINQAAPDSGATPLFASSYTGHTGVVKLLVDAKAAVNQATSERANDGSNLSKNSSMSKGTTKFATAQMLVATPLFISSYKGHVEVVRSLLNAAAAINQAAPNSGATPLFISSQNGHLEVVKALLSVGSTDVNQGITIDSRHSPLTIAAFFGHADVCQALLMAKADLSLVDKSVKAVKVTAYEYASGYPHQEGCERQDPCMAIIESWFRGQGIPGEYA